MSHGSSAPPPAVGGGVRLRSERKRLAFQPIDKLPVPSDNGALWLNGALFYPGREKLAVFIDGSSLSTSLRWAHSYRRHDDLRYDVDYKRLHRLCSNLGVLHEITYFYASPLADDYVSVQPLLDWMRYNGFRVVLVPQRAAVDEKGSSQVIANLDVDLSVNMLSAVIESDVDHIVLFSGNGNLCALVDACRRRHCRVTIISVLYATPDELRQTASSHVDLLEVLPLIAKTEGARVEQTSAVVAA